MSTVSITGFTYDPLPGSHYIHPFNHKGWEYSQDGGREHPRTVRFLFALRDFCDLTRRPCTCQVVEMLMCALSNEIWEKPNWWEKIKDSTQVKEWKEVILEQQEGRY